MLKTVAAGSGDQVCARDGRLVIAGRDRGAIAWTDREGRALPHWKGCRRLGPSELFVFSDRVPNSFRQPLLRSHRPKGRLGRLRAPRGRLARGASDGPCRHRRTVRASRARAGHRAVARGGDLPRGRGLAGVADHPTVRRRPRGAPLPSQARATASPGWPTPRRVIRVTPASRGVVYTILNRLQDGRWGGSIDAVLNARSQFEPVMRGGRRLAQPAAGLGGGPGSDRHDPEPGAGKAACRT